MVTFKNLNILRLKMGLLKKLTQGTVLLSVFGNALTTSASHIQIGWGCSGNRTIPPTEITSPKPIYTSVCPSKESIIDGTDGRKYTIMEDEQGKRSLAALPERCYKNN